MEAELPLHFQKGRNAHTDVMTRRLMSQIDAQGAAMRAQFVDIDQSKAVPCRKFLNCDQGKIGKVFVVDRIELIFSDKVQDVGKLECDQSFGLEQALHARNEIVQVGDLGQHVVADNQVRPLAFSQKLFGQPQPKEFDQSWNVLSNRGFRNVGCRLNPQHRHPVSSEVLQQVSIVACKLDCQAAGVQPEPFGDPPAVLCSVIDPAGRIGGEIRVLLEDVLRTDVLPQLNKQALRAQVDVQRVVALRLIEFVRRQKAFT